jgi:hypothetical protein
MLIKEEVRRAEQADMNILKVIAGYRMTKQKSYQDKA